MNKLEKDVYKLIAKVSDLIDLTKDLLREVYKLKLKINEKEKKNVDKS